MEPGNKPSKDFDPLGPFIDDAYKSDPVDQEDVVRRAKSLMHKYKLLLNKLDNVVGKYRPIELNPEKVQTQARAVLDLHSTKEDVLAETARWLRDIGGLMEHDPDKQRHDRNLDGWQSRRDQVLYKVSRVRFVAGTTTFNFYKAPIQQGFESQLTPGKFEYLQARGVSEAVLADPESGGARQKLPEVLARGPLGRVSGRGGMLAAQKKRMVEKRKDERKKDDDCGYTD
ncbi:hypothetical protein LTR09_010606 [Extremus antarcticus]|uniref:Uncharacterized protein n=1 Tax=Extremus antarcticus TaxID=702011 RepID=A0AAJ0DDQ2_9PEZI|nr:hypothetical protein LTR09_010606 [Extremus antarcticus]